MPTCSYSGKKIPPGTGIMFVKSDGKVLWFADSKCEKGYLKLNRKPRNIKWTVEGKKARAAALSAKETKTPTKKSTASKAKAPVKEATK